ncbi:MAG: hypothetical protein KC656_31005 [Myxococcales bacterium]|nr:hypothetical protein [Myxococcales bacterium]
MHVLALIVALASSAWAGKPLFPPPELDVTEVALGAGFGFAWLDRGAWDAAWTDQGFATHGPLDITPLSVNGELYANRHVPGFDYIQYQNVGGQPGREDVLTVLRYSLTELSYGYAVVKQRDFWLLPRVGAGLVDVEINAQPEGPVRFLEAADEARQSLTVSKQAMVLDLGLGFGGFIPFGKRDALGIQSGLRLTVRAGGLIQLFDTAGWNTHGQEVRGAPDLRVDAPYVRL